MMRGRAFLAIPPPHPAASVMLSPAEMLTFASSIVQFHRAVKMELFRWAFSEPIPLVCYNFKVLIVIFMLFVVWIGLQFYCKMLLD